ncbi:MAG TPA: DUF3857 domain-containing protein [Acidobacteriaceae bacterium]|nr:DUF3857 domain-containing protein [Acidobacteriaceae bacterium]
MTTPASPSLAAEPYYFKTWSSIASMHADGTGTLTQTFSVVVQSEAALRDFGVASLVYSTQSQHAEFVYARVVHPDGSVQETPLSSAFEQPVAVTQQAPEYSDLKSKQLPIRSLRIGDTVEWQVRFVTDHPEVPNQFWGQDTFLRNVVVLDETYELHIPSGLHLTVWTNPRSGVTPTESDANGEHIYRWHRTDLKPTVGAAAEAAKKAEQIRPRTPEEEVDDTKGALPGFAWSTFPDYAAVGQWYRSLTADRIAPDAAIKAKVAELTAGKTNDLEKAQAIYNYVSSQVHYIGVDFGIGRYQPHAAAEVFANQYGDCKDKHTLLASMLSVLNIQADPVLIGAGIRFNSAVASPAAFNHLITHVTLGGKDVWLDATSEVAPWESLLNVLRDKEALVVPVSGAPAIRQTPRDLPYPQVSSMTVVGSLDKDLTADSTITITMHDDSEIYLRSVLRSVSPSSYSEFVQRFMAGMGFGGTTSEAAINNLDDLSKPLEITFHYHRVKEKDWGDNRITAAFQFLDAPGFTPDHPPVEAIQLGAPRVETSSVRMELPKGWTAELPEAVHTHTPFANCDVTYTLSKGVLIAERRYTVLQKEVPLKDAKQYQSWYDDAGASGVPYIQLTPPVKPTATESVLNMPMPVAPAASDAAHPSDSSAAGLVHEAMTSLHSMDLDTGRKDLDAAAKLNPTQPYLWAGYATVAQLLGKQTEVVTDLQHEITYHPDEIRLYATLYQYQIQLKDGPGALQTLRSWEKAAPVDPTPPLRLVLELSAAKQYSEAIREGQAAMDRLEPSKLNLVDLRIAIAAAQAKSGQAKEASAAVEPLLKTVTDPAQLSNITAILVETSPDLDQVRAAQQSILNSEETQTAAWTLDTPITPDVMRKEASLAAAWDTFGWILFKQGKRDDAFAYCLASASLLDSRSAHDHLSAIARAMNKPSALAAAGKSDQELRTVRLDAPTGNRGVAFVTLVMAGGKIVDKKVQTTPHTPSSTPQLDKVDDLLTGVNLHALFPPSSSARLLRHGVVNCYMNTCELVFMPETAPPSANRAPVPVRPPALQRSNEPK